METIRHIFFDLDNTLWDHRKNAYLTLKDLYVKHNIYQHYSIDFEELHKVYYRINEQLWVDIRDGKITKEYMRKHRFYDTFLTFGVINEQLAADFEINFLDEILNYNYLLDNTIEILDYLTNKKYALHIISNGFEEITNRKCKLSGIFSYFTTITTADSAAVSKPNAKIYDYALNQANAFKYESIMIGDDWAADAVGASEYGIRSIYLNVNSNVIESHKDVTMIKSLSELRLIL